MKLEVDTPERGQPWSEKPVGNYVAIVVDPSLVTIKYTDRHEITITVRR